ncbi:MAG: acyl carrier protein [Clostridiales bacterium]|nr:acyl carrier protein [Clostridiales bacterium]
MDETVRDTIKDIIVSQLGCDADDINDFTDIADDLGADSLDVINMVLAVEEDFGVNIPDEDLEELHTFRDVCDYIERNS